MVTVVEVQVMAERLPKGLAVPETNITEVMALRGYLEHTAAVEVEAVALVRLARTPSRMFRMATVVSASRMPLLATSYRWLLPRTLLTQQEEAEEVESTGLIRKAPVETVAAVMESGLRPEVQESQTRAVVVAGQETTGRQEALAVPASSSSHIRPLSSPTREEMRQERAGARRG